MTTIRNIVNEFISQKSYYANFHKAVVYNLLIGNPPKAANDKENPFSFINQDGLEPDKIRDLNRIDEKKYIESIIAEAIKGSIRAYIKDKRTAINIYKSLKHFDTCIDIYLIEH